MRRKCQMKLTERLRLLIAGEAALALLCTGLFVFQTNTMMVVVPGLILEGILLLLAVLQILRPLERFDKTIEAMNREKEPTMERFHEIAKGERIYTARLEMLIRRCSDESVRQNSAQIFDKQTELTALQSQINPHFLYNTLETIRGQALLDNNEEIARMTEALGAFFRYSISRKGTMVTLRDELANVRNYMLIQQYRFSNRFSLEIVVDEEDEAAYECLVPRLIIQPVVENAIFHGLEDLDDGGKVTIEIMLTEENLILMISDNGKGIPEEELESLNERIHSNDRKLLEPQGESNRTGIALPNINRRLRLLYGDSYGINIYSTSGQGTDVEILIPADGQPDREPEAVPAQSSHHSLKT